MQKGRSNIHVSQSEHMEVKEGREQSLQSFHCQRNFAQSNNNKSKPRVTKNRRVLSTVLLHLKSIDVTFEIFQQEINEALVVVSYSAK